MQDLSDLAKNSLVGGSSMHGGNTVSETPPFGSAGIPSEGTADIPTHDSPNPDLGTGSGEHLDTKTQGAKYTPPSPATWKKVP